jgi:hypothetical protein
LKRSESFYYTGKLEKRLAPGGSPASAQISAKSKADNLVNVAGFNTTVFPAARAGATFLLSLL